MYKMLLIFPIPLYTTDGLLAFIEKAREVAKSYSSTTASRHIHAWTELADALEKTMSNFSTKATFAEVTSVFDQITGAAWYGGAFRDALLKDPEALAAAKFLISRLRFQRVPGIDPSPSSQKPSIPPPTPKSSK